MKMLLLLHQDVLSAWPTRMGGGGWARGVPQTGLAFFLSFCNFNFPYRTFFFGYV